MPRLQDHRWKLDKDESRISAFLPSNARRPCDVCWMIDLHYLADEEAWHDKTPWERPRLHLQVSGFQLENPSWLGLEDLNVWVNLLDEDDDGEEGDDGSSGAGYLSLLYYPKNDTQITVDDLDHHHMWRVTARRGRHFTFEAVVLRDLPGVLQKASDQERALWPYDANGGRGPGEAFWRQVAEFYACETIPFDLVTVRVPRNARDPRHFARTRARQLTGIGEEGSITVIDFAQENMPPSVPVNEDLWVKIEL